MDQVRTILKLVWRERFWVLSVVAILFAAFCWWSSSAALDAEFATRKAAIDKSFNDMKTLGGEVPHPNQKVIDGNQEQAKEQSKNVLEVWQELYDRQRNEVLFWPKDSLKASFIETIEKLKFRDPFPVQQAEDMRTHYWNYIGNRFDGLLKIVKAQKSDGRTGGSRFGPGGGDERGGRFEGGDFEAGPAAEPMAVDGEEVDEDYLVQWLDQGSLRDKLQFKSKPTDLQIWVTQEDIWVFETLLNVIANTNKERGATRPDNTAVRVIESLQVGRPAATASREKASILIPRAPGAEGGGEGEAAAYAEGEGERAYSGGEGGGGEGGGDAAALDMEVLANRYLDAEGNPFPGEPEDKEYRRLPIRMRLLMDQRYVPQLLVQCANAALPVEVKQVRINPEGSGAGFGTGSRSSVSRTFKGAGDVGNDPNLADVEIRGIVYIYNQPDETIFEGLGGGEDQLAETSAGGQ